MDKLFRENEKTNKQTNVQNKTTTTKYHETGFHVEYHGPTFALNFFKGAMSRKGPIQTSLAGRNWASLTIV